MYYENFAYLCEKKGVKPGQVSKETGVSTATLTSWKQGKYTPKQEKLNLIAKYFEVPLFAITDSAEKYFNTLEKGAEAYQEKLEAISNKIIEKTNADTHRERLLAKLLNNVSSLGDNDLRDIVDFAEYKKFQTKKKGPDVE